LRHKKCHLFAKVWIITGTIFDDKLGIELLNTFKILEFYEDSKKKCPPLCRYLAQTSERPNNLSNNCQLYIFIRATIVFSVIIFVIKHNLLMTYMQLPSEMRYLSNTCNCKIINKVLQTSSLIFTFVVYHIKVIKDIIVELYSQRYEFAINNEWDITVQFMRRFTCTSVKTTKLCLEAFLELHFKIDNHSVQTAGLLAMLNAKGKLKSKFMSFTTICEQFSPF